MPYPTDHHNHHNHPYNYPEYGRQIKSYPPKYNSSSSNLETPPRKEYPPPQPSHHFLHDRRPSSYYDDQSRHSHSHSHSHRPLPPPPPPPLYRPPPPSLNSGSIRDRSAQRPMNSFYDRPLPPPPQQLRNSLINSTTTLQPLTLSMSANTFPKYREHPSIVSRSFDEIEEFRQRHQMSISTPSSIDNTTTNTNITPLTSIPTFSQQCPRPIFSFEETPFPTSMIQRLKHLYPQGPTPIQSQGWPIALEGRDMVGIASTGSGKTLAYILPAIERCINSSESTYSNRNSNIKILILAPTRELVNQIGVEFTTFSPRSLKTVCIYGGAARGPQLSQLRRGVDVAICTPGRLLDFMEANSSMLEAIEYLVIDEADRMLDLGFEPQIRRILRSATSKRRQTLMWSATWPKEVQTLAQDFMRNPYQLTIGSTSLSSSPNVSQIIKVCNEWEKESILKNILHDLAFRPSFIAPGDRDRGRDDDGRNNGGGNINNLLYSSNQNNSTATKVLIFTSTKRRADHVARFLREQEGISALVIHGDKSQRERDRVLSSFREVGKSLVMVATDVAARGLDVRDVKMVINYDMSNSIEDYVHRIGRTGRGPTGRGTSVTLFTKDSDSKLSPSLVDLLMTSSEPCPSELQQIANSLRPTFNSSVYGRQNSYSGVSARNNPSRNNTLYSRPY